jgi:phosphoribosylanthranilate isomerase
MKAIAVERHADLAAIARYRGVADRLLFDARAPREATRPGGLGKSFDWTLLKDVEAGPDYLLSGGLDAGNIAEALAVTGAPGVDVSSGVERRPGEKDPGKITAFVQAARQAWKSRASPLPNSA